MTSYTGLPEEESWIAFLRTRLPYSFKRIAEQHTGAERRFVLAEPEQGLGSEYHNFWRRGNVYYVSALVLDRHGLSDFWRRHIDFAELGVLRSSPQRGTLPSDWPAQSFFNVIQIEKVWQFAQENPIDRERVVMTNCVQAVELCLKAIHSHATYREYGEFSFPAGHDVQKLYGNLPDPLRKELDAESRAFARNYSTYRARVAKHLNELGIGQQVDWAAIRQRVRDNAYTVFLDGTDPGRGELSADWLDRAVGETRDLKYHRYSPDESLDEYPVQQIAYGLLLGRFLYEHVFPVSLLRRASQIDSASTLFST